MEFDKGEPTSFGPILLGANPATLWDTEEEKLIALWGAMTPDERKAANQPGKGISSEMLKGDAAGVRVGELGESAKAAAKAMFDQRLSFFSEPIVARIKKIVDSQGGLDAMRVVYYGDVNGKKCRDGGRWDFKLASPASSATTRAAGRTSTSR
jgi:hypothetical protein